MACFQDKKIQDKRNDNNAQAVGSITDHNCYVLKRSRPEISKQLYLCLQNTNKYLLGLDIVKRMGRTTRFIFLKMSSVKIILLLLKTSNQGSSLDWEIYQHQYKIMFSFMMFRY